MTELGVFARVFPVGAPEQVAAAIAGAGFTATQLNLSAVGRPTLDDTLTSDDAAEIAAAFVGNGVRIWGVSGTFNMIDPDADRRRLGIEAAITVIQRAPDLSAEVVTLCTGTRDGENMWRAHPENTTAAAWRDLLETFEKLLPVAQEAGVRLGVEPEPGNVIQDTAAAERLLTDLGDRADCIGIVLDPANLLTPESAPRQEQILGDAFSRLGNQTVAVHAKDVVAAGYAAPGHGTMDYALVMRLHHQLPYAVPVIAQDLTYDDAARVHEFLTEHAARTTA